MTRCTCPDPDSGTHDPSCPVVAHLYRCADAYPGKFSDNPDDAWSDRWCCDGDCRQGRDCPNRTRREIPAWSRTHIALLAAAGAVAWGLIIWSLT